MSLDRFYCPKFLVGETCQLDGDEARHLAKVRRVPMGATVEIFDGKNGSAVAEVIRLGRDQVELRVKSANKPVRSTSVALTLAVAIPKRDRFDWLVEKATELGVERIVPLLTERSTVDPRSTKLDRLRRAVIESCKQCRRDILLQIDEPVSWDVWLKRDSGPQSKRWIAHPGGDFAWVTARLEPREPVVVAIGPEGGFTDRELSLAQDAGWRSIHLTSTILRIETAALAVGAQIMLRDQRGPAGSI